MSTAYQPYPIQEFKTGLTNYLQPWIRPADAFEPLVNAYVNRGTLSKRAGSSVFGNRLADHNPVMGIMQYMNQSTGVSSLVVATTRNAYLYDTGSQTFNLLTLIGGANSVFYQKTITATGAAQPIPPVGSTPSFWQNLAPNSVTISVSAISVDGSTPNLTGSITDDGAGNFTVGATGALSAGGTVVYTTGVIAGLQFTGVPGKVYYLSLSIVATTTGGYFSGNNTEFFHWTNWQPTDPVTFTNSVSYLYMTNDKDPITLFDGTNLSRPVFYVNSILTDFVTKTLDVSVYKNRLLFFRPTLNSTTSNPLNQSVYFSALFSPFNIGPSGGFIQDIAGNGGQTTAATGDTIISEEALRDAIVVNFTNSTWLLRFTGVDFLPYRFDKINSTKTSAAEYASVAYDERTTSIGSRGLIACDGTNVQRYDISIIDYYETKIAPQYYGQSFSQRYDNLNQTWMLYVSTGTPFPLQNGNVAPGSDSALIYNFLENSWATYTFSTPMTCMGLFHNVTGTRWQDLNNPPENWWQNTFRAWNAYQNQALAPVLLMGDINGNIYQMDDNTQVTDNGVSITPDIISTQWNPVIQQGQKIQFGYIDIYYKVSQTSQVPPIQVTLNFYLDSGNELEPPAITRVMTLDGPANAEFTFQRVYLSLVGQFIQMEIDPVNKDAFMQFVGFILWTRPAGRLTAP